jgi:MFS family permease
VRVAPCNSEKAMALLVQGAAHNRGHPCKGCVAASTGQACASQLSLAAACALTPHAKRPNAAARSRRRGGAPRATAAAHVRSLVERQRRRGAEEAQQAAQRLSRALPHTHATCTPLCDQLGQDWRGVTGACSADVAIAAKSARASEVARKSAASPPPVRLPSRRRQAGAARDDDGDMNAAAAAAAPAAAAANGSAAACEDAALLLPAPLPLRLTPALPSPRARSPSPPSPHDAVSRSSSCCAAPLRPVRELPFWYGWVILALCTLARLLKSFGQNNTLFVSVPGLLADNGMSRTELGSWFSLACFVAAAVQPSFGRAHDALGGRVCVPAALLALSLSLLGLAAAHSAAAVFVSLIGLRAVGLGALDTFSSNTVTAWFVKRRGTALAAMTIGFYVGTDVGTLQLLAGVKRAAGWRAARRAAAGVCAAAAPLCAALLRSTPEQVGLTPDGLAPPPPLLPTAAAAPSGGAEQTDPQTCPADASPEAAPLPLHDGNFTRHEALRTPLFWSWGAFTLVYFFAASGTDFHLVAMVAESGTVDVASSLSIATGVASGLVCAAVGVLVRARRDMRYAIRAERVKSVADARVRCACVCVCVFAFADGPRRLGHAHPGGQRRAAGGVRAAADGAVVAAAGLDDGFRERRSGCVRRHLAAFSARAVLRAAPQRRHLRGKSRAGRGG